MINTEGPKDPNTVIADGIFFVQSTPRYLNFSIFALKVASFILELTRHKADFWFDVYESPSIKDIERKDPADDDSDCQFCIGPKTKIETKMQEVLKLSTFKVVLEADTRVAFDAKQAAANDSGEIVVRANDADISNFLSIKYKLLQL